MSTSKSIRPRALTRFLLKYLKSREAMVALGLLGTVLAGNVLSVRLALSMNEWNGRFFDALATVNRSVIIEELVYFAGLASLIILVLVFTDYLKSRLILKVRREFTSRLFDEWLSNEAAHYRLRETGQEPDNPDQRLLEDSHALIALSLRLFLSFVESLLTIGTFTAILWSLSVPLTVGNFEIPGYMFWACVTYTLLGTLIAHWIGHPLKALNIEAQRQEADLRYSLIEKRRHADAIAGAHGEPIERLNLNNQLNALIELLIIRLKKERDLSFFTVGMGQVTHMTPMVLGLPGLLSGTFALGGLMQLRGAFVDVARSLSWFIVAYDDLARLAAVATRLDGLLIGLEKASEVSPELQPSLNEQQALNVQTQIVLPDGTRSANLTVDMRHGDITLLKGPSGSGKSTALKVIAGFYSQYKGYVQKPQKTFWLPQTAYLLKGTLRANLCYPNPPHILSTEALQNLCHLMALDHLTDRLDEANDWHRILSGGEAQRVMLIRACVTKPDLLLLDETTSALDAQTAQHLVQILQKQMPTCIVLMVTHQALELPSAQVIQLNTVSHNPLGGLDA